MIERLRIFIMAYIIDGAGTAAGFAVSDDASEGVGESAGLGDVVGFSDPDGETAGVSGGAAALFGYSRSLT